MEHFNPQQFTFNDSEVVEQQQTTNLVHQIMADPENDFLLSDEFVVNLVDGMEDGLSVLTGQDAVKVVTEEMYSDLITFDDPVLDITPLAPALPLEAGVIEDLSPSPSTPCSPENSENSLYSPLMSIESPATPPFTENGESLLNHPLSSSDADESITQVVSPSDVFGEQAPPKRKRGRKPKSEQGLYAPPRPKKVKKIKVYEIQSPLEDKELERKRLNAVNAKRHRDLQKKAKSNLEVELAVVKKERDSLKMEVDRLKMRESQLSQQLNVLQTHCGTQALSLVTLIQNGQVTI